MSMPIPRLFNSLSYPPFPLSSRRSKRHSSDIGCCSAQDIPKLVSDGPPSQKILGSDLRPVFIDLGYDLFRGRDGLKTIANVLYWATTLLFKELDGKIYIIHAVRSFHLFNCKGQGDTMETG